MVSLSVNGKTVQLDLSPDASLLWTIRDHLKLTGTKYGCGIGECGGCTVHINGKAARSCLMTIGDVKGKKITTIEGLPASHPVKQAWIKEQVVQCGYCQPGVIMQVASLMAESRKPDPDQIIAKMENVICRCGTHLRMKKGIRTAVQMSRKEGRQA